MLRVYCLGLVSKDSGALGKSELILCKVKQIPSSITKDETAFSEPLVIQPRHKYIAQVIARNPGLQLKDLGRLAKCSMPTLYRVLRSPQGKALIKAQILRGKSSLQKSLELRELLLENLSDSVSTNSLDTKESLAALKILDDLVKTDTELGLSVDSNTGLTDEVRDLEVRSRLRAFLSGLTLAHTNHARSLLAMEKTLLFLHISTNSDNTDLLHSGDIDSVFVNSDEQQSPVPLPKPDNVDIV